MSEPNKTLGLFVEEALPAQTPGVKASKKETEAADHLGHRDRLRRRFLEGGAAALQDYELLEFLLFGARPRGDTKPLAKALIRKFGSFAEVITADPNALREVKGVSDTVIGAIKIAEAAAQHLTREQVMGKPVLSTWFAVVDFCRAQLAHKKLEEFHLLFLDRKNQLIAMEQHRKGSVDQAQIYVREIVKRALELHSSAVILVHNHPSGDPQPSQADVAVTNQIRDALSSVSIDVHDHLIIGKKGNVSFKQLGLL